jgi:hypothetical protein
MHSNGKNTRPRRSSNKKDKRCQMQQFIIRGSSNAQAISQRRRSFLVGLCKSDPRPMDGGQRDINLSVRFRRR